MPISSSAVSGVPGSINGSSRVFVITEMRRVGASLQPAGEEFRFSAENFSAPRGPWNYSLRLRTVRHDLPGSEEPVEQVLGWNYLPFQISGVWDDRYVGANFAEDTRRRFEDMVKRGRSVRITMEEITVFGLITDLNITRQRKDRIGYQFTLSPHNRHEGETVRVKLQAPRVTTDPRTSVKKARQSLEALQAAQALARAENASRVQQTLSTDIFRELDRDISEVAEALTSAENTVANEILKAQDAANALNRGAQTMESVKSMVSSLLNRTRSVTATTSMAVESIVETLQFETWLRGVGESARRLMITAHLSKQDFETRARPNPARLHRVRPGETLYTISNLYYGTPHNWRAILNHNHLSSIVLEGGELLSIPENR
jgi:hypothetical protein